MATTHHAIQAVARRTGLSMHVIRIWEKRYRAVEPARTETNRRRYSDEQVERLSLLRDITHAGHSIGAVAKLPIDTLRQLAQESQGTNGHVARVVERTGTASSIVEECVLAVKSLDSRGLEASLRRGATEFGAQGLLQKVIAPLAQSIGELWRDGSITAAHEHFASGVIRIFLAHAAQPFAGMESAPLLVVATPVGQLHEIGALLVGAAAANVGWQVTYLGASLPAAEIAGAARQNRARVVALSLVYPEDDPRLEGELTRLRDMLAPEVTLLAGGRAAPAYHDTLDRIGALQISDLTQLCSTLDRLRRPAGKTRK